MKHSLMNRNNRLLKVALLSAASFLAIPLSTSFADELVSGGIPAKDIAIDKVDGDKLFYKTSNGTNAEKAINEKLKLSVTDEPNLTAAEDFFNKQKYSDAVDNYLKVMRSPKPWLKDFAAYRLIKSGEKADRFDAVVTGYLAVLQKNPTFAKEMKISIPTDPKNTYLKTAATQIDTAITATRDPAINSSLLSFRMNIARAMGDQAKVLELAGKLTQGNGAGTGAVDATTLSNIVEGNLSLISASIEKKDYAAATKALEGCKASVVDQKHQIEWLWLTAVANEGQLGDSKDAAKLKDLALDYLRVSANFSGTPRAGEALLKTAKVMEKLNDIKAATAIYQQVEREFKGQPASSEAKSNLTRIGGAK